MSGSLCERTGRAPAASTSAAIAVGPGIISRVRSILAAAAWISVIRSRSVSTCVLYLQRASTCTILDAGVAPLSPGRAPLVCCVAGRWRRLTAEVEARRAVSPADAGEAPFLTIQGLRKTYGSVTA